MPVTNPRRGFGAKRYAPGVFINRIPSKEAASTATLSLWFRLWSRFVAPFGHWIGVVFRNRRVVRYVLVACNVLLLVAIGFFTLRGSGAQDVLTRAALSNSSDSSPLDQISSAEIAANAAKALTNYNYDQSQQVFMEATSVINNADSVATVLSIAPADSTAVAKPQAVATTIKTKADIQEYEVQSGDNVASIAAKFNVTSDSIMWSNNLRNNNVPAGTKIQVPPVNGIVYTVRDGDTPDSLAQRYRANKDQLIQFNDIELSGLKAGEKIVIPNGQVPAPVIVRVQAVFGYNGYDYGWCTWYAANRRAQLGRPVPANLGDAYTWASRAAAAGIPTGASPQNGAVAMRKSKRPGHVAVVEVVNSDGSFWISEMNSSGQVSMTDSRPAGGWGKINWKLIPASSTSSYTFIY